ncbi:MAG: T9SS type A sorting domain-containing protein [Chitinophagales bacterium]
MTEIKRATPLRSYIIHKLVLVALLLMTQTIRAQNMIGNSSFENNNQPECSGWFDRCGHELNYLCAGIIDSANCNDSTYGMQLYADAPNKGGQWCMSMRTPHSAVIATIQTTVYGQFMGVFEFKVWVRNDTTAGIQVFIEPRSGLNYTGQFGTGSMSTQWTQLTLRDTISQLSNSVDIRIIASLSSFWQSNVSYFDMAEFSMVESWTDIPTTATDSEVNLFPHPFANELTCVTADQAPSTITLYTLAEQPIRQQTFTKSMTLDTQVLPAGIYFYQLRNANGLLKTGKVVKQ